MINRRTPPWKIQLRFIFLCLPLSLSIATVFSPWFLTVLFSSCMTIIIFWNFAHFISNGYYYLCDPDSYRYIRARGIDPFYNSIGWPFNTDSEEIRSQGLVANCACPGCHEPLYIDWNMNTQCSRCGSCWSENRWWIWNGIEWVATESE